MKILIYSRPDARPSEPGLRMLIHALESSGIGYAVNADFSASGPATLCTAFRPAGVYDDYELAAASADIAVSFGGDGTFLDCVRLLGRYGIPVLGINSGRLGFLANIAPEEMARCFSDLAAGNYSVERRPLLEASGDLVTEPAFPCAFNEFSVQRNGISMISVEAYIGGRMVATYWGDGILLSTAAGSTAYTLSVGGPIVDPRCGCFVLSPIAPHNLTMRPVVIPDDSHVVFRVHSREKDVSVTLDNTEFTALDGASINVRKSDNPVFVVRMENISFYETLRNKMLWGIDRRDEGPATE